MMNINQMIKLTGIVTTCVIISACGADFDNPVGDKASSSGSADFTTFVALGDSLTAGYADAALYLSGQENSYPAILAAQFARAGGNSNFSQPLVNDNFGGLLFGGVPNPSFDNRLVLDAETQSPGPIAGTPTTEVIGSGLNGNTYNNMGVTGAKSFHVGAAGYGDAAGLATASANPYFVRFASSAAASMIGDAVAQAPSFYVMWIGANDVLSYATSGGIGVDQTGNFDPTTYGSNDITDPNVFAGVYSQYVAAFAAANPAVQGLLVNIPDISSIPYFTTVPHNAVPLDQTNADALNAAYAAYNGGVQAALGLALITPEEAALRTISFSVGQNAVVILDEDLTDITGVNPALINLRQANESDLIVLPAASIIGTEAVPGDSTTVNGLGVPLADELVLISSEIQAVETARLAYNATIKAIADADDNLVFFDAASLMDELSASGIDYGTGFVDNTYVTGGAFSLDGVHPTARGYAVIANEMIDVINAGFGASILKVDPGEKSTIFFK